MLRYRITRIVNADISKCVKCLLHPERFLEKNKHTHMVAKGSNDTYDAVFKIKKLGVTKYIPVQFRVTVLEGIDRTKVKYESTEKSSTEFSMEFNIEKIDENRVKIDIDAKIQADVFTEIFGRKDFKEFIEELLDHGISTYLRRVIDKNLGTRIEVKEKNCKTCALFDDVREYCYFLRRKVEDPTKPPCEGRHYIMLGGEILDSCEEFFLS